MPSISRVVMPAPSHLVQSDGVIERASQSAICVASRWPGTGSDRTVPLHMIRRGSVIVFTPRFQPTSACAGFFSPATASGAAGPTLTEYR
jgi:hypothetical protein